MEEGEGEGKRVCLCAKTAFAAGKFLTHACRRQAFVFVTIAFRNERRVLSPLFGMPHARTRKRESERARSHAEATQRRINPMQPNKIGLCDDELQQRKEEGRVNHLHAKVRWEQGNLSGQRPQTSAHPTYRPPPLPTPHTPTPPNTSQPCSHAFGYLLVLELLVDDAKVDRSFGVHVDGSADVLGHLLDGPAGVL